MKMGIFVARAALALTVFAVAQAPGDSGPATFSSFVAFDPVATGFGTPDPSLDIFAVKIDLSSFGITAGATVDRVRLHLFDHGLGSKGADIAALGALNSVPEASVALLLASGPAELGLRALAAEVWSGGSLPSGSRRGVG